MRVSKSCAREPTIAAPINFCSRIYAGKNYYDNSDWPDDYYTHLHILGVIEDLHCNGRDDTADK